MQMHLRLENPPLPQEVALNMQRLAELGLRVHITELDMRLQDAPGSLDEKLAAQANVVEDMARTCLAASNCEAFFTWGLTDHYSWIPGMTGREDQPLLFAENWQPKPAYWALYAALRDALFAGQP
jgi:endo-1,4-beta-xylanase